jgi:hypothetical protein
MNGYSKHVFVTCQQKIIDCLLTSNIQSPYHIKNKHIGCTMEKKEKADPETCDREELRGALQHLLDSMKSDVKRVEKRVAKWATPSLGFYGTWC